MAFPYPSILSSIEELLVEVRSMEGVILVSESRRASFVSFSEVGALLSRLRLYPGGGKVAELLRTSLFDSDISSTAKPVLVLKADGTFWLGLMDVVGQLTQKDKEIEHLNRCFKLNILE